MGYTLPDPNAAKKKKPAKKVEQSANQGTATQGVDFNSAGTVSYITSFLPGAEAPTKRTEAQLNKQLYDMTPQERIAYATKLKAAGYPVGPINGAVTKDLRNSWLNAHSDLQVEIQAGQALDLPTFLAANSGAGGSGTGTPRKITQVYEINDTDADALINKLYQQLTGYKPSPKELAAAKKDLRKQEKLNPVKQAYDAKGSLVQTGGLNEEQYLTEQLGKTDAAITSRATTANELLLNELGGLR